MAMVVPTERQPLAADALFRLVRSGLASFSDDRLGDTEIALTDESLRPLCQIVFRQLQRGKALEPLVFLEDSY